MTKEDVREKHENKSPVDQMMLSIVRPGQGVKDGYQRANDNSAGAIKLAPANEKRSQRSTFVLKFAPEMPKAQQPVEAVKAAKLRLIGFDLFDRHTATAKIKRVRAMMGKGSNPLMIGVLDGRDCFALHRQYQKVVR